jgi:uncharacterized Ntn-hydrolase superfamily protein
MTYSIVARDEVTGRLGIAIQSHFLAVGHQAVWGKAGVGVIASQANVSLDYGLTGLHLLESGELPSAALRDCQARDESPQLRQVAMLDAAGRVETHTGRACWDHAAHHVQGSVSAQANMVASPTIPRAMVEAFLTTTGSFPRRLLAALDCAEALRGDLRGRQSSALLVVDGRRVSAPDDGVLVDLRVDNSPEPLRDLRRAYDLKEALELVWPVIRGAACRGPIAPTAEETEMALDVLSSAQEVYGPANLEPTFWMAMALARANRLVESERLISEISQSRPGWRELYDGMRERGIAERGRRP